MTSWIFAQLWPIRHPRANGNAALLGVSTLGIEVTEPELARQCGLGNIDPQHSEGGSIDRAAIDDALDWPLPKRGATLATLRPDSDALGAMAVLLLRARKVPIDDAVQGRVHEISRWDRFDQGSWADWRVANPPLPGIARIDDLGGPPLSIKAVRAVALDQNILLAERVFMIASWIETGSPPYSGLVQATAFEQRFIEDWNSGRLRIELDVDPRLALVRAPGPAGLQAGYRTAPVVAAEAQLPNGRKLSLAQFELGWIDVAALLVDLNAFEPGWGGSKTIIGSPQGAATAVSLDQLAQMARAHLLKHP
jgi:hypothetical protein